MIPAISISVVLKKVLEIVASNEKGRKVLLYVIGITVFLLLLPVIVVFGFLGWMGGDSLINLDNVVSALPPVAQEQVSHIQTLHTDMTEVFESLSLSQADIHKAEAIYYGYLVTKPYYSGLCRDIAECFFYTTSNSNMYDNVENAFSIHIPSSERNLLDKEYGITPQRIQDPTPPETTIPIEPTEPTAPNEMKGENNVPSITESQGSHQSILSG